MDSRAAREAEDLIREGAAERIFAEAGDWVSITSPARLRWLARHRPDLLRRVHGLGMLSDWIVYRLARVQVTEPSCGSSSGMFSLARRTWSAQIAQICGLPPEVLPEVVDPGTVVGAVTAEAAAQTGLRAGTPVAAGGADTQLGLLGAGVRAGEFTVLAGHLLAEHRAGGPAADRPARSGCGRCATSRRASGCWRASGSTAAWRCAGTGTPSATPRWRRRGSAAWTRTW